MRRLIKTDRTMRGEGDGSSLREDTETGRRTQILRVANTSKDKELFVVFALQERMSSLRPITRQTNNECRRNIKHLDNRSVVCNPQ